MLNGDNRRQEIWIVISPINFLNRFFTRNLNFVTWNLVLILLATRQYIEKGFHKLLLIWLSTISRLYCLIDNFMQRLGRDNLKRNPTLPRRLLGKLAFIETRTLLLCCKQNWVFVGPFILLNSVLESTQESAIKNSTRLFLV